MATRKAIVIKGAGDARIVDIPVPSPKGNQVVVKTTAVALNPIDAVFIDYLAPVGTVAGCDFAGTLESIGDGVDPEYNYKPGDRVAGYVMGCMTTYSVLSIFPSVALVSPSPIHSLCL